MPTADTRPQPPTFRAELRPHRSASARTLNVVILALLAVFVPTAIAFVAAGAWPVTGFMGFELLLLYGAFWLSRHRGSTVEYIDLTREALRVERVNHWGQRQVWTLEPTWTRITLSERNGGRGRLELRSRGQSLIIGEFLTLEEQAALSLALEKAVATATGPCWPEPQPA
jgi:uncharacterized membrane protein